jgi:hypothetical protein
MFTFLGLYSSQDQIAYPESPGVDLTHVIPSEGLLIPSRPYDGGVSCFFE